MPNSIRTTSNTQTTTNSTPATFKAGDSVLCSSVGNGAYKLFNDKEYDCLGFIAKGKTYHYRADGKVSRDDKAPSLFHNTPANRQAINMLYNGAPITQLNQVANDSIHAKNVEIQRLSWLDVLFTTIKDDLKNGDTYKAQKLADLGQYLAQDFQHYSEDELTDLQAEQGADNE